VKFSRILLFGGLKGVVNLRDVREFEVCSVTLGQVAEGEGEGEGTS
jgi:hypothetical protein